MADFGQNDEVVSKPSVATTKSSWGSGDEVVTSEAPRTSASAPIEGSGGAAFGVYPKPGMKPNDELSRAGKNIGRSALEASPAAAAGLYGFGTGAAAVATPAAAVAAVPVVGPFAAATLELSAGLGGAFLASGAAQKVTNWMHEVFAPEDYAQRKAEKEAHPYEAFAGETIANLAGMSPKTAPEIAGKLMTKPVVQRATSAALQAGIEAGTEYATEGKVDPIKLGVAAGTGLLFPGFNAVGKVPFAAGEKLGQKISSMLPGGVKPVTPNVTSNTDLPPKSTAESTPEERAAVIKDLKERLLKKNAEVPLVEAGMKNTKTGEELRMGPKHDEEIKQTNKDNPDWQEGFFDERGNFLTRKEAWNRAKSAKQIPEGQTPEQPQEGLHSGDLRTAGDERFKVSEEQPAGTPHEQKPYDPQQLTTRDDYKTAISDKETTVLTAQLLAEESLARGNEAEAARHNQVAEQTQQELDQLHKDIPAATFKDAANPTWEELQDHLWGAKTVGEALDRVVDTKGLGSIGQRILVKALNKSGFIREAKLEMNKDFLKYTDKQGKEADAAGLYVPDNHTVQIGATGNLRVLLHETVHAGTVRLLSDPNSATGKQMTDLFNKYKEQQQIKYEQALENFKKQKPDATIKELQEFEKLHADHYGYSDVYEFVSEAFTSKDFQTMLSRLEVREQEAKQPQTLWESFKEVVRLGLGIPEGARTALDDVIETGAKLIEESSTIKHDIYSDRDAYASKAEPAKDVEINPRDIKDEEHYYEVALDIFEKSGDDAALKFYEGYKEYKQTWLEPIAETEKFVGTNLKNKLAAERVISNNKADVLELAKKDDVNLEQLTYDIDKGEKLTGAAKTIADKFRALMDDLGKRAIDAGVINGWHEDYVARNVVSEGAAPKGALQEFMQEIFGRSEGSAMGGVKTTTKYGEPRRLKTRKDLLNHLDGINRWLAENGKDYRFKLKTDNLAEIYADYAHSVEKAIENKNLVTKLKQVRNAAGEALIRPITKDDPLPHGWEVMDNSELAGYAIHPDVMPALKFVFDSGPGNLMQALGHISQLTKRINVIGSFFHAKSLMEVMSSAQIPIWTPVKEAIVLPLVEKGVKALTGKELQLSAITKAVNQFRKGGVGDNVDRWIKDGGLQLEMPEDVTKNILSATGKFADEMIGKYGPKTRVLESTMSTVEKYTLGLFDKYTWDYLHTGGKLMVADAYLDKARMQAAKEGKPFDEANARKEISRFVNDSFGGLNWFDAARSAETELGKRMAMAAYSPAGRRGLQLVLFAPDWTISTLRAFTAALPKELNPSKWHPVEGVKGMMVPTTKADYARLYQFKTALTYLTLINAINMMTADRPIWENKDPTRIEWPDGTSMQAMKHAMEPYHWIADPDKTFSNKMGFIPKALIIGFGGLEYASPNAPKLIDRSASNRLLQVVKSAAPFQVQAAAGAPEGEGAKRAALGTLGFPVYGSTPAQRKLANAERELATKEQAWKYRDKEIKAGRERMTIQHRQQGETLRKRRQELNRKTGK